MIELNVSRIAAFSAHSREFRMISFKAADVFYKIGGASAYFKIRMALRAIRIARVGKPNRSAMIGVAGSAGASEGLTRVMHSPVMASEAFLVDHFFIVETQRGHVTRGALLSEHRMRG
jgi:hypothetical protein